MNMNQLQRIEASAPGSLMLLGEYAVLKDGHALACAINQRVHVQLVPRADDQIELISVLGTYKGKLSELEIVEPFQFVLAIFKKYQKHCKKGCTLTITSDFSNQMGLASSAAVTVATLVAVAKWLQTTYSSMQLIQEARELVRQVQGLGSGADVAACVLGGVVAYRQEPLIAEKIEFDCPLTVVYSGRKMPTVKVVNQVETFFSDYPAAYHQLLCAIDECAKQGIVAVRDKNLIRLGDVMRMQQGIMSALGVNTPILQGIIDELLVEPAVRGAKISGSGLGDCVVALGNASDAYLSRFTGQGAKKIPLAITAQGVHCEEIRCR